MPGYPVHSVHLGVSFFEGGCRQGGIVYCMCIYDTVWMGCPRRTPLTILLTPSCFRILSTYLTSVSIFSVCCFSRYLFWRAVLLTKNWWSDHRDRYSRVTADRENWNWGETSIGYEIIGVRILFDGHRNSRNGLNWHNNFVPHNLSC